jgi:hypothetical protein
MKYLSFIFVCVVLMQAAEKPQYQTGTLTDLQRYSTGSGALRAQGSFCLAVQVEETTYLVRHEAYGRWSYEPTDMVVGDPVEAKIDGNHLYFKKPKGGTMKTSISRRERNQADKPAPNCGLPVSASGPRP